MGLIVKPNTFIPGTVIRSAEVNDDFDTIYNEFNGNINQTNLTTLTGTVNWNIAANVSAISISKTGLGAGNVISISNLGTGFDIQGTGATWKITKTGDATFNTITGNNFLFYNGADLKIFSDAGVTLKFQIDGSTGSFGIPSGSNFYLTGTALGGDEFIQGDSAGHTISLVTDGGTGAFSVTPSYAISSGNLLVNSGSRVGFDGAGGNDYWVNSADGQNDLFSAGILTIRTQVVAGDRNVTLPNGGLFATEVTANSFFASFTISLNSTRKLLLDGAAGNTSLRENGVDFIVAETNGTDEFSISTSGIGLVSGDKIYLDGVAQTGDTFIDEVSSNVMRFTSGGVEFMRSKPTGEVLLPDVDPPTANYINRNSGVKAWAYVLGNGTLVSSYNVSSVSRTSLGHYQINWNTNFANSNYVVVCTGQDAGITDWEVKAAGDCTFVSRDTTTAAFVDNAFHLIAIGDQ